jgi:hypothetical protein
LIYLVTLTAIGLAFLRRMLDISPGYQFIMVMAIYVSVLVAYFAFRFPILIGRLNRSRDSLQSKRTEMVEYASHVRQKSESE